MHPDDGRLVVNAEDFCYALRQRAATVECWLDRLSGEIHVISDVFADDEIDDDDFDALRDADPQRYLRLPVYPPAAAFEDVQLFLQGVDDIAVHAALSATLQRQRAFQHFLDALAQWPIWQQRWQAHAAQRLRHWGEIWLRQQGIAVCWQGSMTGGYLTQ